MGTAYSYVPKSSLHALTFRTSSSCGPNGPCVGIARRGRWAYMWDTKDVRPDAPVLRIRVENFRTFMQGLIAGEFPAPAEHAAA